MTMFCQRRSWPQKLRGDERNLVGKVLARYEGRMQRGKKDTNIWSSPSLCLMVRMTKPTTHKKVSLLIAMVIVSLHCIGLMWRDWSKSLLLQIRRDSMWSNNFKGAVANSRKSIASNNFKGGVVAQSRKSMERGDFKGLSELYVVAMWAFNAQLLQGNSMLSTDSVENSFLEPCRRHLCNNARNTFPIHLQ